MAPSPRVHTFAGHARKKGGGGFTLRDILLFLQAARERLGKSGLIDPRIAKIPLAFPDAAKRKPKGPVDPREVPTLSPPNPEPKAVPARCRPGVGGTGSGL